MSAPKVTGLELMRAPFPDNQISKLPKGTKAQNECAPAEKRNCTICGGWHHPKIIHLDYVGHAAVTDRLLDADPYWSWEPLALDEHGLPRFDASGGLWIKLTVGKVTRLGYGHAAAKSYMDPGSREKEVIGDAIRNAAMRFGAALELWHKGDLHIEQPEPASAQPEQQQAEQPAPTPEPLKTPSAAETLASTIIERFGKCATEEDIEAVAVEMRTHWEMLKGVPNVSVRMQQARAAARDRAKRTEQAT